MSMSKRIVAANVKLKRAYEAHGASDGARILIDRLWPRGVMKANAAVDLWAKDIAPAPRAGGGSDMIPLVGRSSDAVTRKRSIGIAPGSTSYAHSLREAGLHSFLRRMMKSITTLSS